MLLEKGFVCSYVPTAGQRLERGSVGRGDWNFEDKSLDTSSPRRPGSATCSQDTTETDPSSAEMRKGMFQM